MALLRRTLYLQAAVFAASGLALAIAPRFVLVTLFSQVPFPDYAWVRIAGIEAFGLAMFMVLVVQRSEQVWWWSWAFVLVAAAVAVIAALNAAVGLREVTSSVAVLTAGRHRSSAVLWWLLAAVNAGFGAALLWGLGKAGQERPLP